MVENAVPEEERKGEQMSMYPSHPSTTVLINLEDFVQYIAVKGPSHQLTTNSKQVIQENLRAEISVYRYIQQQLPTI